MDSKLLKLLTHYNLDAYYGKLVILGIDTLEGFSTISDESILSLGIERDSNDFIQIKKLSDLVRSTLEKMEKQKEEIQNNNTKAGKTSILKSMRVFFVVVALMIAVSVGITLFQNGNQPKSSSTLSWREMDNSRDAYEITVDMLYESQGSSIKMCGYSNASVSKDGTRYTVKGYFDTKSVYSNNMVRMDYTIVVEQTSATTFVQKSVSVSNARFI